MLNARNNYQLIMTYSMVSIMQATFGSITWLLPTEIVAG
jgi:hypothetical protein